MPEIAVASVSRDSAAAGARMASAGGNAVDAAVASALAAVVTHPGMCSLGGGCFLLVLPPGGPAVAVDGGLEMPGRGLPRRRLGGPAPRIRLAFAGGVETVVGPASVATPGLLAGCAAASGRWGRLPWAALVEPARERAERGFPLPEACHRFLVHAHDAVYGRDPRSHRALHDDGGELLEPGDTVRVEGLAGSLATIAREGADAFYRGELAGRIADHVRRSGGILTRRDLESYRPDVRRPLELRMDGWTMATNPPPAVGGALLGALLRRMEGEPRDGWTARAVARLVEAQREVFGDLRPRLLRSDDLAAEARRPAGGRDGGGAGGAAGPGTGQGGVADPEAGDRDPAGGPGSGGGAGDVSPSTLHVSAVDADGLACSVTLSDGYGSGVMPPGTGIWLNNALGEAELNRRGWHGLEPGTRLTSDMAPTVARDDRGSVLALGTPGAGRIPSILAQTLLSHLRLGLPLAEAVERPRLHVEADEPRVVAEPGLPLDQVELPVRRLPERSIAFGGVAAVLRRDGPRLEAAGDPRRGGGTAVGSR